MRRLWNTDTAQFCESMCQLPAQQRRYYRVCPQAGSHNILQELLEMGQPAKCLVDR